MRSHTKSVELLRAVLYEHEVTLVTALREPVGERDRVALGATMSQRTCNE